MEKLSKDSCIGVIGAGTMGSGIAQLAASFGHKVVIYDTNIAVLKQADEKMRKSLDSLVQKGKITDAAAKITIANIHNALSFNEFAQCNLIIEAVIEEINVKQDIFKKLEQIVSADCILATNTSSLSVTSIAASCNNAERVIGIHFFNPAPIMPLVEIVPGIATGKAVIDKSHDLINVWNKTSVIVKDTPGFIVNRVARPFYGEAIRIYEEGIADFATIDWAMKEIGGFKMGPFELMDFIGNDINFKVTETVWTQLFYDNRYRPSLTQKRLFEAGFWGRKKSRGYYSYAEGSIMPDPNKDKVLGEEIFMRIIAMLINEAYDAWYLKIASKEDLEMAMTKGVNYPKGLIKWSEEIGLEKVLNKLLQLHSLYLEDRYRPSILLRKLAQK
ncbi:MAG TPA: 3-hydroxyacyl-CoA dehydrogenase NAD-binding domain-containing protein [Bacteroidia bacterium]|jgi:3-hydroxybutyryl-CoA dehydrogenase|nr:3-hydroxyacyl-CoA dehydrogenase NAD-binding domain-containing protein [Bacteroidia bacterium]